MVDLYVLAAVALLAAGVIGSVVPVVPGPLFSLGGVYLYWWSTGYADPGTVVLVGFTLVGVAAIAVDFLAGAMSARAGGASTTSSVAATVAGTALFFVAGPVGVVVGVGGAVFAVELLLGREAGEGGKAALYAALGVLASGVVQAMLTLSMLLGFLLLLVV